MSIQDIVLKVPGILRLINFIGHIRYKIRPPRSYTLISLFGGRKISPQYDIYLDKDQYGIRITAGSELPIKSVNSRNVLQNGMDELQVEVDGDSIDLIHQNTPIDIRFFHAVKWTKIQLNHHFSMVLGLGEKGGQMNKLGRAWEMWNIDNAKFEVDSDPLYKSYPIMISRQNQSWIAFILDYPGYQKWDLRDKYQAAIHVNSHTFQLDVIFSSELHGLVRQINRLLGNMDLPPLWSLGYHQCRWSYYPASTVLNITQTFRQKSIPIDAVYLDIDYMDGYRCFTWDKKGFGDLPSLIKSIHDEEVKVVAMIDPGVKKDEEYGVYQDGKQNDYFIKKDGEIYHDPVWPGDCAFPDFYHQQVRDWWADLYGEFIELGVDGFWNDMNEPSIFTIRRTMDLRAVHVLDDGNEIPHADLHNLYGQKMVQASYTGIKKLTHGQRVFLLSRSGYLGSQQFGWIWTGDNRASWDHLKMSIPKLINSGLSGHFANGPDIGGFRSNPSPELYARWIQIGVFYPFMRTHSSKHTESQEPWSFGPEVEKIAKEMITLRYKLLPYIYTYFELGCREGIPLMRPMFMEFSTDEICFAPEVYNTQFMIGPDLLVAPVLDPGIEEITVYLPSGTWYHYFNHKNYQGGKYHTVSAPLDTINVFVREQRLIPVTIEPKQNGKQSMESGIEFLKFGKQASCILYLDDFNTFDYKKGKFGLYRINSQLEWDLIEGEGGYDHYFSSN